jgi:hypothetical protein
MRKKIDPIIFRVARIGLAISMIVCLLSAIVSIITLSFNLSGEIWVSKNTAIRLSEFGPGIPFHATLGAAIPDSSIVSEKAGARSLHNYYSEDHTTKQAVLDSADYSDKILSDFKVLNGRSSSEDIRLSGGNLNTAVFYIQSGKLWDRLVLSIPRILPLLLIAFCSWQLLLLVSAIHSGTSFTQSSPKRIASIGWAILITALLLFIFYLLQNSVDAISLNFSSTIPNYRMPFDATAYKENFSQWGWFIGGAIILLVAKAFSYGNQLQKYEDLTV